MKQFSNSYMLASALILLTGQLSQALPTNSSGIVTRADAGPVPGLYGASGEPVFADLVDANNFASDANYNIDLDLYTNILLGFVKCKAAWVQSWFPNVDEYDKLLKISSATQDNAFMLRYNQTDGKRHAIAIATTWSAWKYLGSDDERGPLRYGAWWPWALLEGAYNGKKDDLDMKSIVMALSGEELTSISNLDADEYWTILKEAHRSPMSVKYDGLWHTVLYTNGTGPFDGSVMLARVDLAKYEDKEKAFSMGEGTIEEIKYLLGTPDFSSGKRKGDIQF